MAKVEEGVSGPWGDKYYTCKKCHAICDLISAYDLAKLNNRLVADTLAAGGTAEDCVVGLVEVQNALMAHIAKLEVIAPKKIKLKGGQTLVWRCPDELIPETAMPEV